MAKSKSMIVAMKQQLRLMPDNGKIKVYIAELGMVVEVLAMAGMNIEMRNKETGNTHNENTFMMITTLRMASVEDNLTKQLTEDKIILPLMVNKELQDLAIHTVSEAQLKRTGSVIVTQPPLPGLDTND